MGMKMRAPKFNIIQNENYIVVVKLGHDMNSVQGLQRRMVLVDSFSNF